MADRVEESRRVESAEVNEPLVASRVVEVCHIHHEALNNDPARLLRIVLGELRRFDDGQRALAVGRRSLLVSHLRHASGTRS